MSLDGAYDPGNVFARILRGDMPSVKVFEDDRVLAIMDVFPQAPGHLLVIPKITARNLIEAPPDALGPLFAQVQRLAGAVRRALKPDGVMITQLNGAAAGQTIFHLHVHIVPVWTGQPLGRHGAEMANIDDLRTVAEAIAKELAPAS